MDRTPALPTGDNSERAPQPGPGASATHGTAEAPGRTGLPCTVGLNTAWTDPAAVVTDQGYVSARPDPAALRPGRRLSWHGTAQPPPRPRPSGSRGTARHGGPGALLGPTPAGRSQREPRAARRRSATHTNTIASLLSGRRAATTRLPRRSAPRPSPTGVQGGPSAAARSQWPGSGGRERARS